MTGGAVEVAAVAAVAVEPPPLPATVKPMDTPATASTTATAATDHRCFRHLRVLLAAGGGVHGGVFILRMVPAEHEAAVGKKWESPGNRLRVSRPLALANRGRGPKPV